MRTYPQEEQTDIILIIGECVENCLLASRVYAQRYPNRRHPYKRSLEKLLQLFRRKGSVSYNMQERQKLVTENRENEYLVMLSLVEYSQTSQRKIYKTTRLSRQNIQSIIKNYNHHPDRIQLHQQLSEEDYDRGLKFC